MRPDLDAVRATVERTRAEQGLGPVVDDDRVLDAIAAALRESGP